MSDKPKSKKQRSAKSPPLDQPAVDVAAVAVNTVSLMRHNTSTLDPIDIDVNAPHKPKSNAPDKPKSKKRSAKSATLDQPAVDVTRRNTSTLEVIDVNAASLATNPLDPIAVDVKGASRVLGIPVPTLNGWRSRGGGPRFAHCGRGVRYPVAELHRWLADRVVGSTGEAAARAAAKDRK
jgi:hypothetical protein